MSCPCSQLQTQAWDHARASQSPPLLYLMGRQIQAWRSVLFYSLVIVGIEWSFKFRDI